MGQINVEKNVGGIEWPKVEGYISNGMGNGFSFR